MRINLAYVNLTFMLTLVDIPCAVTAEYYGNAVTSEFEIKVFLLFFVFLVQSVNCKNIDIEKS